VISGKHNPRQSHGALIIAPVALKFFLKISHDIKLPPCVVVADGPSTPDVEIRPASMWTDLDSTALTVRSLTMTDIRPQPGFM
jgi:hypothetical protein